MEFWIVLGAAVVLVAGYPYLRCAIKRIILISKLKAICKRKKFHLYGTHPLWFFGGRRGNNCDFYIETQDEILSIKLFGTIRRSTILLFTENGQYFTRHFIAFMSNIGVAFRQPIDGKKNNIKDYYFRKGFHEEWEIKSPKNILLINPACHEIRWSPNNGAEKILGAGDTVNGAAIYSLSNLLGYLEVLQ